MFKKYFSMLNIYPRRLLSLKQSKGFNWAEQDKILMQPFEHVHTAPSKFYELLAPAFNHWLQAPDDKLRSIAEAMPIMSTYTVLVDDIQDKAAFRYGKLTSHQIFGTGLTINAAYKILLIGQKLIADLGHPSAPDLLLKTHEAFFYGQGIDLYWTENLIIPSEEAHIAMSKQKHGSWFALPVQLLQLFSEKKTDYSQLACDVGVFYAIVDDYVNLFQSDKLWKLAKIKQNIHNICSDVTECKITLAVIHASQFPDIFPELAYIYKQRTSDPKLVSHAISLLKKHGSDEYTREAVKTIEAEIRSEIDRLGGNPKLTKFMDELSFY